MMPPHTTYIETHLGGSAIMRRKPAALRNIGIDLDARALDAFECDYPVEFVHGCAHRYLAEFAFEGTELVYCDPPYLKRTRTSCHRYRFDYEEADHVELLGLLAALPCAVMVSGYPSALYDEHLRGWRSVEWQVMSQGGCVPRSCGSTLRLSGCTGRLTRGATSPTASASSARPRAGLGATRRCRCLSALRCSVR